MTKTLRIESFYPVNPDDVFGAGDVIRVTRKVPADAKILHLDDKCRESEDVLIRLAEGPMSVIERLCP